MTRVASRWAELFLTLILLALLVGVNFAGLWVYRRTETALAQEHDQRHRAEMTVLALRLQDQARTGDGRFTDVGVQEFLQRHRFEGAVGVYGTDGRRLAAATAAEAGLLSDLPSVLVGDPPVGPRRVAVTQPLLAADGQRRGWARFVLATDAAETSRRAARLFYELPLWLTSLLVVYWLGRQVLIGLYARTGRDDALPPTDEGEMRLVAEGYQQVIDRLQLKGRELERQREAERVRAESSERFSDRLVVSIPSALIVVSDDGAVSVTNVQARALFGDPEPAPLSFTRYFDRAPDIAPLVADALKTGDTRRRAEIRAEIAGSVRFLEASVSPIPGRQGGFQGVLCLVNDTTEVVELRAGIRLKETLAGLGEMAAGIAHEFKNSLATIAGYAQMLERVPDAAKPAGALRREVAHLTAVVTDFLDFARPGQIRFAPLDLRDLLADCVERLRPEAEKRGVTLALIGGPSERRVPEVAGDATLLRRAFLNLIQNGIEAIPETAPRRDVTVACTFGPALPSRTRPSFEAADPSGGYCRVTIADTGAGIPSVDLANIFIPFFTTKSRGYGIGLALVQKVFVGHNGWVEVESEPAAGTVFTCYLPVE